MISSDKAFVEMEEGGYVEAVIFIGVQATGKSTFYKDSFLKTHIRINMDMLKTRNRENILLEACIRAKQPFVVDNTNPTVIERKKYIDAAKVANFKVIGYYFQSKIEEAILRNESRDGNEQIPITGIKNTYAKLQLPSLQEGFDELYYVQIDEEKGFIIKEWEV